MKYEVFYGKGMKRVKERLPDLYESIASLNESVFNGTTLDYKTQKLIAIGIAASRCDSDATKKQMRSSMNELEVTEDEIIDVLRVVLLLSGMPAFNQGMRLLDEITSEK
ncbi:carboxymuconolactone decarboxylase family protein [archaeon]|nr:MAG: carboxymuconolactone decarboxylase family protein [archaeon]